MKKLLVFPLALLACCGGSGSDSLVVEARPRFAFVTNCVADFWTLAQRGVEAAAKETGADCSFYTPTGAVEEQQRILEDQVAKGVDGIAVSPKDPDSMRGLLDRIAGQALLLTHDSDAPGSKRLAYVGVSNYTAGRMCGELVKAARPNGGVVVLFIGTLDQDNSRARRQGVVDELLGRTPDPRRFDAQDAKLEGNGFEIRATYTDEIDHGKCKATAQDALARWADVDCLVGMFEYEPPLLLDAVKSASRIGKVAVVGFDEADATLQGIVDGTVAGTIVQNPYEYGRQSVLLLDRLFREKDQQKRAALLPKDGFLDIPARRITKDNVQAFWADKKQKLGK
ncbi:MAG: sugar-binding protein [Planctomycetota bacterium]